MKTKSFPQRGDYVRITSTAGSRGDIEPGTILKVTLAADNVGHQATMVYSPHNQYAVGQLLNFNKNHVEPLSREDRADVIEKQATELDTKVEAMAKEAKSLRSRAKALRDFESDEMEIATRVAEIMESSAPKSAKLKQIAELEIIDELRS